jgi:hypothetical protein
MIPQNHPLDSLKTHFFEQMRETLSERCGIIREEAFVSCDMFLDEVAEKHSKTANAFIKTQHPLLIYILGYQDGLVHALQRILRMRKTGEYYSTEAVHARMHGYDHKIHEFGNKRDFWNAAYAHGYQSGLLFLLLKSKNSKSPKPPFFTVPLDVEFNSLAAVLKFPKEKLPKPLAAEAKRILRTLPKGAELVPDHTPFL